MRESSSTVEKTIRTVAGVESENIPVESSFDRAVKQTEDAIKAHQENIGLLQKSIDDYEKVEQQLMNPSPDLSAAFLAEFGPDGRLAYIAELKEQALKNTGVDYSALIAEQERKHAEAVKAMMEGKPVKKFGAPDMTEVGKAVNEYEQALQRIRDAISLGQDIDPLEEELKAVDKVIQDFINAKVATPEVELLDFRLSPDRYKQIQEAKDMLEGYRKVQEKLQMQQKNQPKWDDIKVAETTYNKEITKIEGQKAQGIPMTDVEEATRRISALETVMDALWDADLRWDNSKFVKYLNELEIQSDKLKNAEKVVEVDSAMASLEKTITLIDANTEREESLGNVVDDNEKKYNAYAKAHAIVKTLLGEEAEEVKYLKEQMALYASGVSDADMKLQQIQRTLANKMGESPIPGAMPGTPADPSTAAQGTIQTTYEIFMKLADDSGYKSAEKMFADLGIQYDVHAEKSKALSTALSQAMNTPGLEGEKLEKIIRAIIRAMIGLGESAESTTQMFFDKFSALLSSLSSFTNAMASLVETQKQRELSAAGQSAKKREAIERKYFEKQKKWQIAQANMNIAQAILAVWAQWAAYPPVAIALTAVAAAAGIIQLVAIQQQTFAKGGKVKNTSPLPQRTAQGDDQMALVKSGEVILNRAQQAYFGGPKAFKEAGVPEFANGAIVYGDMLARVAEYPGARSNPEVIAPLDKLASIIRTELYGGVQDKSGLAEINTLNTNTFNKIDKGDKKEKVVFRIHRDELVGILEQYSNDYINL